MKVHRKNLVMLFLFGSIVCAGMLPMPAAAGIVPCGLSVDDPITPLPVDESAPCTICHVIVGGKNLMDWGMKVMTVIALTVILAMGVLYIISAGDQGMMQTAKGGLKAAFIGFAVMLSAWLIVNIILTVLVDTADVNKPFNGLTKVAGVFSFFCDTKSNVNGH